MTDKGNIPNSYIAHSAAPAAAVWGAGDERWRRHSPPPLARLSAQLPVDLSNGSSGAGLLLFSWQRRRRRACSDPMQAQPHRWRRSPASRAGRCRGRA